MTDPTPDGLNAGTDSNVNAVGVTPQAMEIPVAVMAAMILGTMAE